MSGKARVSNGSGGGAAGGGGGGAADAAGLRGFERAGAITPPAKNMAAVLFFAVADAGRG